jgi:hypothetical protein
LRRVSTPLQRQAAIDDQFRARDVACVVAGKEQRGVRGIPRSAAAMRLAIYNPAKFLYSQNCEPRPRRGETKSDRGRS